MSEIIYDEMMLRFKNSKYKARMAAASVMMRNIYKMNNKIEKVDHINHLMKTNGWIKEPGFSEIDIYGKLHRFYAGDEYIKNKEGNEGYDMIDDKLKDLCEKFKRECGYQQDYSLITRELNEDETEQDVIGRHSEKIALVYGLLMSDNEYVIVINKNLRICTDCHDFMRFASLTENRKIIVSDQNRVHVFQRGTCSCNNYY